MRAMAGGDKENASAVMVTTTHAKIHRELKHSTERLPSSLTTCLRMSISPQAGKWRTSRKMKSKLEMVFV